MAVRVNIRLGSEIHLLWSKTARVQHGVFSAARMNDRNPARGDELVPCPF